MDRRIKYIINRLKYSKTGAFTLVEMLLSIGLILALAGVSIPLYANYQNQHEVNSTALLVKRTLRSAQLNATSSKNDSSWGVKLQVGQLYLFEGSDFSSRNTEEDIKFEYPENITITATTDEIIFSKVYGELLNPVTINMSTDNISRSIQINEKGIPIE